MKVPYIYIKGKKTQLLTAFLALFMWNVGLVGAMEGSEPKESIPEGLTLDEAVATALEHSPKIGEAREKIALAELDVKAAVWWRWLIPNLTVAEGYDFLSQQERAHVAMTLDLSKILGEGLREERQAEIKLFNSNLYYETVRRQTAREAAQAFFEYAAARQAVPVKEEVLKNSLKLREVLKIKFEHGSIELDKLLAIEETISSARLEVLKARQNACLAEMKLIEAMGLPMESGQGKGN
jgi:outer membrane protein TolC